MYVDPRGPRFGAAITTLGQNANGVYGNVALNTAVSASSS